MSTSNSLDPEGFRSLQKQLQQYSVDQLPYRTELRRLSEVESYLEGQLKVAQEEINSLDQLAQERAEWAESIQGWQKKLEHDIELQTQDIVELSNAKSTLEQREAELSQLLFEKTAELEEKDKELYIARFSLKQILVNLKDYLIRYTKERLKL